MIETKIQLRPFTVPNYVQPVGNAGKRQDGFRSVKGIKLGDLDQETIRDLCTQFREDVFARAMEQQREDAKS